MEHPPERLQLPIDARNLKPCLPALRNESANDFASDGIELGIGKVLECQEALHTILVILQRLRLRCEC